MSAYQHGQPRSWRNTTSVARYVTALITILILTGLALPSGQVAAHNVAASVTTAFPRYIVPGTVPYVHQRFGTPDFFSEKDSACGSTSLVMALGYMGKASGDLGVYVPEFHPNYSFGREPAEAGLRAYGLSSERVDTLEQIVGALERGHVVIAGSDTLTPIGHIVLVIGYERTDDTIKLIVNDPWGDANLASYGTANDGASVAYAWEMTGIFWGIEVLPGTPQENKPAASDIASWKARLYRSVIE